MRTEEGVPHEVTQWAVSRPQGTEGCFIQKTQQQRAPTPDTHTQWAWHSCASCRRKAVGQGAGRAHAALGEPAPAPQRTFTLQPCLSALLSVPPTQSTPSCPGAFAQATQGPPLVQASPVGSY